MRARILSCCLVLALARPARADEGAFVAARRMRKSGAGLTAVGAIHLSAGLALTLAMAGMDQSCAGRPFPCGEGIGFLMVPSLTLIAIGAALTGIGMPLLFIGRRRERALAQPALIPTPIGQLTPVPPSPQ